MNSNFLNQNLVVIPQEELIKIMDELFARHIQSLPQPTIEEKEELLSTKQVAELLHTTVQNIHAKKKEGKIPFVRLGGKVLFKKSEVIASLKPAVRSKSFYSK